MKREMTIDELTQIADDAGLDIDEFLTDYNGRYMHDATCIGLVTHQGPAVLVPIAFALQDTLGLSGEDITELLSSTRQDSMGQQDIYYWPNITLAPTDTE